MWFVVEVARCSLFAVVAGCCLMFVRCLLWYCCCGLLWSLLADSCLSSLFAAVVYCGPLSLFVVCCLLLCLVVDCRLKILFVVIRFGISVVCYLLCVIW